MPVLQHGPVARLPTLWLACLLCLVSAAAAQEPPPPDRPEVRRVIVGSAGDAELITLTHALRDRDDATRTQYATVVRRRAAGAEADDWRVVARYARQVAAAVNLGDREMAVLLEPTPDPAATRPAAAELRLLTVSDDLPAISDPAFDPRAVPVEARVDAPPGVRLLDLAAAPLDGTVTLHALGDAGGVFARQAGQWRRIASLPDGLAPADADLAGGDRLAVAGRLGGAVGLWVWEQDAWRQVGRVPAESFAVVEGVPATFGGPLLLVDDARVVRFDAGGTPESVALDWALPEDVEVVPGTGGLAAGAMAVGSVRLARTIDRTAEFVEDNGPSTTRDVVARLSLDPDTLRPVTAGDGPAATTLPLVRYNGPRLGQVLPLILYGGLIVASLGMLKKPDDPDAVPPADVGADLAPLLPRALAGLFDALPVLFVAGVLLGMGGRIPAEGRWMLVVIGLATYVALPLIGEVSVGRSAGKAIFGLRVVRAADGAAVPTSAAVSRGLIRPLDLAIAAAPMWFTPRRQRLGDFAAGTTVVRSPVRQ